MNISFYKEGKKVGHFDSPEVDEHGLLDIPFDPIISGLPEEPDLYILDYHHTESVPVDIYTNFVHRRTQTYFASNTSSYLGDTIYQDVHRTILENIAFCPGVINDDATESLAVVENPYDSPTTYQATLYLPDGTQVQSDLFSIKPRRVGILGLSELFPRLDRAAYYGVVGVSLCISSQHKSLVRVLIKDRRQDIITSFDHSTGYYL